MKKSVLKLISLLCASALTLSLMFTLTLPMSGCSKDSKTEAEPVTESTAALGFDFSPRLDKGKSGSIRVMGNFDSFEALEAVFADFRTVYPNAELVYEMLDDYGKNIIGTVTGENAPDIYFILPWMLGSADYQALLDASENLADPSLGIDLGILHDELVYKDADGRVPALPVYSSSYGMLVNEDIFKLYGLKTPATYTELLSACATLKQAGYRSPIMGFNDRSGMFADLAYPYFCGRVKNDADARAKLNAMEPGAGEYMRSTLDRVSSIARSGCIDLDYCNSVPDGYNKLIYRFLEGDVPMMLCHGDAPAGALRRQTSSKTFAARPFKYSFCPIPLDDNGPWYVNSLSLTFGVSKNSKEKDLANEFMRFLCTRYEINKMSVIKGLMPTTKDIDPDNMFAAFNRVDDGHTVYTRQLGLTDAPANQLRIASHSVANNSMSVDEAVSKFGSLK